MLYVRFSILVLYGLCAFLEYKFNKNNEYIIKELDRIDRNFKLLERKINEVK